MRRAALLGLLGCALLVGGCGGGGGAGNQDALAAATKQPNSQTDDGPASARGGDGSASKRADDVGSPQKAKAKKGSGAARAAAASPSVAEPHPQTAGPAEQGPNQGRGIRGGHAGSSGGGKPKGSGKGPGAGNSGHVVVLPTTGTNGDPYTLARQFCGDQANVDLVPPQYRSNVNYLAQMYAHIFDPEHQEAAQAGCLAGLHDLGL